MFCRVEKGGMLELFCWVRAGIVLEIVCSVEKVYSRRF